MRKKGPDTARTGANGSRRSRRSRRALGALFVVLTAMFAGIAYAAFVARQWPVAFAAAALCVWMGGMAARALGAR